MAEARPAGLLPMMTTLYGMDSCDDDDSKQKREEDIHDAVA